MFIEGRISWLVITLVFSFAMLLFLYLAKRRIYDPDIRMHPGITAVEEAIDRAVEMGRPVTYSPGGSAIYSTKYAGDTAAALAILGYVAKQAANKGAELIVGIQPPSVLPIAEDIVRDAFLVGGRPEAYIEEETVRFLSPHQWGWTSAYMGMLHRERPAANMLFGGHAAQAMIVAETGATVGAVQIAGSTNVYQIPFFVAACDYTLIAEDEYAAAAYVSEDPVQRGVILGQDFSKLVVIFLSVVGAILATFGNNIIKILLGM